MSPQPQVVLQDKPSAIPIFAEWIGVTFVFIILAAIVIPLVRSVDLFAYLYLGFTFQIIAAETVRSIADLVNREFAGATLTQTYLLARQGLLDRDGYSIPLQRIQDTSTHFALAGQVFDYGNLVITTPSRLLKIRNLPHPKRWEQQIQQRVNP